MTDSTNQNEEEKTWLPREHRAREKARVRDQLPAWFGVIVLVGAALLFIPLAFLRSERPQSRSVAVLPAVAASLDPASLTERGRLYVPAYSTINAAGSEIELTVTLSIRNASAADSLLIERVNYLDTSGALVRQYFEEPRTLAPLSTEEVIIPDRDLRGGSGAKFLIDWAGPAASLGPVVEAVMIGSRGTQGFSFISPGRPVPRSP
jgi:hypothetical protein